MTETPSPKSKTYGQILNAMTFHPTYGTFVTAGSDGAYNFWDKARASKPRV